MIEFLNISIIDDNIAEPTENFNLAIETPQELRGISLGVIFVATGFITDDDGMTSLMM